MRDWRSVRSSGSLCAKTILRLHNQGLEIYCSGLTRPLPLCLGSFLAWKGATQGGSWARGHKGVKWTYT